MRLHQYSVTQLRLGATCPRIHYFDSAWSRANPQLPRRVSLLWKAGGAPAGGGMFHRAIERFTKEAAREPLVLAAIERAQTAVEIHQALGRWFGERFFDPSLPSKPVEFSRGYVDALNAYLEELATVAMYARTSGVAAQVIVDQLFADARRRVDVTFDLGEERKVRVTGALDYVFYDWRTARHRIFDYKLTPGHSPNGDLIQVATYALAHHQQHGTHPDAAVYYLHPERSLVELGWDQLWQMRAKVYDHLASMVAWEDFDEGGRHGLRPPGVPTLCGGCPWRSTCEERLGPKHVGAHVSTWESRLAAGDPPVLPSEAPVPLPEPELDESGEEVAVAGPVHADGLVVGEGAQGTVIVPTRALNTHIAVVGAAGSGKTWTAKVIAEEAVRNGVPVIAIDPQGDLVQFLRRRDPSSIPPNLRALYEDFAAKVEPRVFTPGSSHGRRLSLDPIRLPRAQDLAGIPTGPRRQEEEEALLQALAVNLASIAAASGDRSSQENYLLEVLRRVPREGQVGLEDVVRFVRDPDLVGILDPDLFIKPSTRSNLALRLYGLVQGVAANLFKGGEALSIDAMLRPSRAGLVPLNVIYLNAMTNDDQKQFFVASLASELYRWMITRGSAEGAKTNVLFYLDEARDYIPAGTAQPMAKGPLLRLFSQGRKFGVGCLICTQSPRSVDYNAFGNCSSKVIGRLESSQDVDRVREWFTAEAAPPWLAHRKGAEPGSFVARWATDVDPVGASFRGRLLFSAHEGAWSPDRVEGAVHT